MLSTCSNVGYWHLADIDFSPEYVRLEGESGPEHQKSPPSSVKTRGENGDVIAASCCHVLRFPARDRTETAQKSARYVAVLDIPKLWVVGSIPIARSKFFS